MKKYGRSELSKMNKNNLINIIIELQENIIISRDMIEGKGRPKKEISNNTKNKILHMHFSGKSSREIGKATNLSHTKILQIIKETEIPNEKN